MEQKKLWAIVLTCVLLLTGLAGVFSCALAAIKDPGGTAQPQYDNVRRIHASLSISGKTATCKGEVATYENDDSISLTVKLFKKEGSGWGTVTSWSTSGRGSGLSLSKTQVVDAGTYRVKVTAKVTPKGGKTETVTRYSAQCTVD